VSLHPPAAAATLLGVNKDALAHALTTRSRVMREGVIVSPLNVRAAVENRWVHWSGAGSCVARSNRHGVMGPPKVLFRRLLGNACAAWI
jgi:hypothetical protein